MWGGGGGLHHHRLTQRPQQHRWDVELRKLTDVGESFCELELYILSQLSNK